MATRNDRSRIELPGFLKGVGGTGAAIFGVEWGHTPLGPIERWPQSLRTAINIMISSKQPMFLAWGAELTFIYNEAYAPILGEKHPSAMGQAFKDVWPEIWDDLSPLIDRALAGESTWANDLHLVMERNGYPEDTWYSFSYSPIRDDADTIVGMFCSCIETTAQVIAERQSTAERERLFAMTRDLFGVATLDGAFKSLNPAWSRVLGRPHDELLARPFSEIIHPDDLGTTVDVLARLERGEPVHQFLVRLVKSDGEPMSFAWSAFPDSVPDSDIFYTVGRDITDDLRRDQGLRHSQKMEAIGQLTGGIAHDFNNLLQAVQGAFALILRKPKDTERVVRLATNGLSAGERGAKLTSQLLAFSRSQKMELKATALAPLLKNMEEMLRHSLGPTIRIEVGDVGLDLAVMIDPTQFEMAILNLAINARDAMTQGGELKIAAHPVSVAEGGQLAEGPYIDVSVSDTGTGMSLSVAAQAFDPFFTTKGVGQGTGLGLSQVYGMTTQAGGTVRIEHLAQGTAVIMTLKAVPLIHTGSSPQRVEVTTSSVSQRKVLVIDDDLEVRSIVRDLLESIGMDVTAAEDGPTGLSMLDTVSPDIVLVDFAMPGMNGAEVAERIRARRPDLPIVFASGYSDTAAIEAAVGPTALLLRKPFNIEALQAMLNE